MEEMLPHELQIAALSRKYSDSPLTTLHQHLTVEMLEVYLGKMNRKSSVGIDGEDWSSYEKTSKQRIPALIGMAKSGRYRAPHVRRVQIPKGGGGHRPLGIPTIEDKLLQRGVSIILNPIYEQEFKDYSYGSRKGKSAHQAVDYLWEKVSREGQRIIIDADLKGYFDTIDHSHLRDFLERRVRDGVILRLLGKWLNAGVLTEHKEIMYPDKGTPQGGVISPLLANIYLHYVLDVWFTEEIQPLLRGKSFIVRYMDDFVLGFEYMEDAKRVKKVLPKRMSKYGLQLHETKTKMIDLNKQERGARSFDFLGFTHYMGKSRKGRLILKHKTSKSRYRRSIVQMGKWLRRNRRLKLEELLAGLSAKLRGHYNYYGITHNLEGISTYYHVVKRLLHKWLNRRGGKRKWTWERLMALLESRRLPTPRIVHSRLRAKPY